MGHKSERLGGLAERIGERRATEKKEISSLWQSADAELRGESACACQVTSHLYI